MNVLFLFWGRTAGGARYSLEVAKALSEISDVNLYLSLSKQSVYFKDFESLKLPSCHVDTYESFAQMVLQARNLPMYRKKLGEFIRNHKVDIVYAPMTHIWNAAIVSLFQKNNVKYVLTMHDAVTHAGDMEWLKNWLLRKDVGASTACITLTQTVKQGVHAVYDYPLQRIKVIPHGVFHYGDFNVRKLPAGRPIRLLFYGRILKYKGLNLLLEALNRIPSLAGDLKIELQIWGDGNLSPYAEKLSEIKQQGIAVYVENRWIDEQEIENIFRENDVCVLPYIEASQSGVAAIAFATAMPIVATPQPGLIEQLKKGGGIVSERIAPEALAEVIVRVCSDTELYAKLSSEGLDQAEHELSWNKIGRDVVNFLCKVSS